jgi:YidC/Oxa1 family membrane protein insertase
MDRKSWIIVTLCVILMGVNWHYMQENQKLVQAEAARTKQAEAAKKAAATSASPTAATPAAGNAPAAAATPAASTVPEETHSLKTGSVTFELTSKGGGIARAALAGTDQVTLNKHGLEAIGALRREPAGLDAIVYKLTAKSDKSATFEGTTAEGVVVTKTFTLTEGAEGDEHLIDLKLTLKNTGTAQHRSEEYYLYAGAATALRHDDGRYDGFFWNNAGDTDYQLTSKFFGKGFFSDAPTEYRHSFNALRYTGVMSRFYTHITTRMTEKDAPGKFWAGRRKLAQPIDAANAGKAEIEDFASDAAVGLPVVDLAPGASVTENYQIYLGPKEYDRLSKIGHQRSYAMFYGYFKIVSIALSKVMRWMHSISSSWGLAVILLTIFVRLCLWPIHAKSTMTMKRMGLLGPLMKELQEKYKDNPQQQQMEVMKLYKDYGVNPLGGCLPLFLQFPIFIGLYSVLEVAAELRGQSFWWVRDLAAADTQGHFMGIPINPLPLIMGLTMVAQMKLTPQPATVDKTQQRIFMMMPLFFLWISYDFAAALALYWSTQNIFSIFQTRVMKLYMPEPKLEKVSQKPAAKAAPPAQSAFFNTGAPSKDKKKGPKPPRLGG